MLAMAISLRTRPHFFVPGGELGRQPDSDVLPRPARPVFEGVCQNVGAPTESGEGAQIWWFVGSRGTLGDAGLVIRTICSKVA
jgi:hypothetical protein